jgi:type II secretory ATPase GspE/PulE/Tfp pilus assembly ATPase PilB-like protein
VLRILGGGNHRPSLANLELEPAALAAFVTAIEQPYGTVIVCGPTGSGKTTTLYGALDHLNRSDRVVMTIEDPVEYRLDGINQIEVDAKGGLGFASGLRTILRSDPDVLLVGEVRDPETASIAIQPAMTGHLVLTSLHATTRQARSPGSETWASTPRCSPARSTPSSHSGSPAACACTAGSSTRRGRRSSA